MESLKNKNILLGVTGGIAAYKSAEIVRGLKKVDSNVRVVMTKSSKEFITPLTMQTLSGNKVFTDFIDDESEAAMGHIELAKWADVVLIAPCTADTISRLVMGRGNDLLAAIVLAFEGPLTIAPAMNQAMWRDQSTQENIKKLIKKGFLISGPSSGDQACGDNGPGRMEEPKKIIKALSKHFTAGHLKDKTVLITAGPTIEPIDPVRFISNRSSGKMGYALVEAAVEEGAEVILISGPVNLNRPNKAYFYNIKTAQDMYEKVMHHIKGSDIYIGAAAVSDFSPSSIKSRKIKKNSKGSSINLKMKENKDILLEVSRLKKKPFLVGFAAETENLLLNAKEKLLKKNLDLIIGNDISKSDIGFDSEFNEVMLITREEEIFIPRCDKRKLARKIINYISNQL